jgi:cell division protein FtsB
VLKKLYEQFCTGVSVQPNQFERDVISELQKTMDRLHAENVQLRAESDAAYVTVAKLQRKLEIIADITKSDFTPIIISAETSGTVA